MRELLVGGAVLLPLAGLLFLADRFMRQASYRTVQWVGRIWFLLCCAAAAYSVGLVILAPNN